MSISRVTITKSRLHGRLLCSDKQEDEKRAQTHSKEHLSYQSLCLHNVRITKDDSKRTLIELVLRSDTSITV